VIGVHARVRATCANDDGLVVETQRSRER